MTQVISSLKKPEIPKKIMDVLNQTGLKAREPEVYYYITRTGAQTAHNIAKYFGIGRVQVYRVIHRLEKKGFMSRIISSPNVYEVVPFSILIKRLIDSANKKIAFLKKHEKEMLEQISAKREESGSTISDKYMHIVGEKQVLTKVASVIRNADKDILFLTRPVGIVGLDYKLDIFEKFEEFSQLFPVRIIIYFPKNQHDRDIKFIEPIKKIVDSYKNLDFRYIIGEDLPRFIITKNECLYDICPVDSIYHREEDECAIWTNSKMFIKPQRKMFETLWEKTSTKIPNLSAKK